MKPIGALPWKDIAKGTAYASRLLLDKAPENIQDALENAGIEAHEVTGSDGLKYLQVDWFADGTATPSYQKLVQLREQAKHPGGQDWGDDINYPTAYTSGRYGNVHRADISHLTPEEQAQLLQEYQHAGLENVSIITGSDNKTYLQAPFGEATITSLKKIYEPDASPQNDGITSASYAQKMLTCLSPGQKK